MSNQLTWKKGLPTEPGYYWFRNMERGDNRGPSIYSVREYGGRLSIDNAAIAGWTVLEEGEWAGPIPLPAEGE